MRVLILDSDVEVAEGFRKTLKLAGHAVTVTCDNETAIEALFTGLFDFFVADLMVGAETSIPALDCARLFCPKAEVILVTGSDLFPSGELHFAIAHIAYRLQKPVRPDDLAALVAHCTRTPYARERPFLETFDKPVRAVNGN